MHQQAAMHIEKLHLHIPVTIFSQCKVGIEFGHEFVKVCYIAKIENDGKAIVDLLLFDQTHIREALQHVANHAHLPVDLHVTGTITEEIKLLLKEVLHTDNVNQVNKSDAEMKGHFAMLRNCNDEELEFVDDLQPRSYGQAKVNQDHLEIMVNMKQQICAGLDETSHFPCVVVSLDIPVTLTRLNDDGSSKLLYVSPLSGTTFSALSSVLLDVHKNCIHEAAELSNVGNRIHVDSQAKEVFLDSPDYGGVAPEAPIFSFGKLADKPDLRLEDLKRADVAHSMLGFFAYAWYFEMFLNAMGEKVSLFYIGGSLAREKTVREELCYLMRSCSLSLIKEKFYRTGIYAAAVGCLLQP